MFRRTSGAHALTLLLRGYCMIMNETRKRVGQLDSARFHNERRDRHTAMVARLRQRANDPNNKSRDVFQELYDEMVKS